MVFVVLHPTANVLLSVINDTSDTSAISDINDIRVTRVTCVNVFIVLLTRPLPPTLQSNVALSCASCYINPSTSPLLS